MAPNNNYTSGLTAIGLCAGIVAGVQLLTPGLGGAGWTLGGGALLMPAIMALGLAWRARMRNQALSLSDNHPADHSIFNNQKFPSNSEPAFWQRQFHKLLSTCLAMTAAGGSVYLLARKPAPVSDAIAIIPVVILTSEFLLLLMLGRYLRLHVTQATNHEATLLAPLATLCEWAARLALLGAGMEGLRPMGWWWPERMAVWGGALLSGLVALEYLFRSLTRDEQFEDPRGLARYLDCSAAYLFSVSGTQRRLLAETLDYQFGYAFSRTWVYRFMARAALPFISCVILLIYAMTTIVIIMPEEQAILERWGVPRPGHEHLESGWHWKMPWPIDTVRRFPIQRVQTFNVGFKPHANIESRAGRTISWQTPYGAHSDYFLTPAREAVGTTTEPAVRGTSANLLIINAVVEYVVTNLQQYVYGFEDPRTALQYAATRVITHHAAGWDMFDILTTGRADMATTCLRDIQATAEHDELGVEILFVGIHNIQPPVPLVPAFHDVVATGIEQRTLTLDAQTWAARQLPLATAQADTQLAKAAAYRLRRAAVAAAAADRFQAQIAGYDASPRVYRARRVLRALADGLARARKYVVAGGTANEVLMLNLEEKIKPDFWDLTLQNTNDLTGIP